MRSVFESGHTMKLTTQSGLGGSVLSIGLKENRQWREESGPVY